MRPALPDNGAVLLDGVVIAPRHGLAYVMRPGGGIDAVSLASGAVRWHSDSGAKPIAVADDRLLAQAESRGANALNLVVLDARSGAARESLRLPLPAGVAATVVDAPGGSFRVRADRAGSELVVRWRSTALTAAGPVQGYLPAETEGQAPAVAAGQAVVDLGSPSLKVKTDAASSAAPRPALQEVRAVAAGEGRQFLSADGRHVLVTELVKPTEMLYRYQWTVYDHASGARIGSVPALVAATPFLVAGTTLYHTEPLHVMVEGSRIVEHPTALRAVNLTTGAEAWRMVVQDTAFKGPFPP